MFTADQYQSFKAADIAAFYDISKYVSTPIRQVIFTCAMHPPDDVYYVYSLRWER